MRGLVRQAILSGLVGLLLLPGCGWHGPALTPDGQIPPPLENPLFVPVTDREFVWNQIVDTVDNHFQIERESRVKVIGGALTEGRIDTFPLTGATYFEPWRRDSTPGFQRTQDTLQSTRRRAQVQVIPSGAGYLIHVFVFKELEDLSQPEHSTVGGNTLRHDGTLVRQQTRPQITPVTLGWIPLGRDVQLEQRMLAEMQARLTDFVPIGPGP